jgi:DDE superfamily endonuclease
LSDAWKVWRTFRVPGVRPVFPPELILQVKALACELPKESGQPLSRFSRADLAREVTRRGLVAKISGRTIWRWLDQDALRPWQHRSWIFPRDPDFQAKAERVLDLYQGVWEGHALSAQDYVISADEKTSIQARVRLHPTLPPEPKQPMRVEFEYERGGALAYLAAWDVRRAKIFGRCENATGIEPFGRLVQQVMAQEPYRRAQRVFWIVDNGSSHRGAAAVARLQGAYPNLRLVHLPVHASWLNQVEIYFSILQRKVLTPNDFASLDEVRQRLLAFAGLYEQVAAPFEWKFTRADLHELLHKLKQKAPLALAA